VPVKEVPVFSTQTNAKIVQVVDLHNSVKVKNKNLILVNQLQKFHRNLNHAIRNKQSSIVFIHGVGQGVLKSNLERLLRKNNIQFSEASYQKYGYGAMEIFINTATKPLIYRAD
jgi:dsDNA-specific endonuclease/ATPase MutS2